MTIQKIIKKYGYSIEDVAKQMPNNRGGVGTSQGGLSTILNGNPTVAKLRAVANILGISFAKLVAEMEEEVMDTTSFLAIFRYGGETYTVENIGEAELLLAGFSEAQARASQDSDECDDECDEE